ncbi:MAG: error-prone polymerase, partial [Actinomycetota bacterium]|nr:error-prone polymerase [Actinomycetota bacterium]
MPAEALPHIAARYGMEAIALTDHDALSGAVRFSKACKDAGVKPIFGAELGLRNGNALDHITLLARNETGYGNLCHLISDAHLTHERGSPESSFEQIVERADGLFVLSGCERGEVARLAAAGDLPGAVTAARRWRSAIGDGYRLEVFDHRTYGSRTLRDRLLAIARDSKVTAVATNDVHYAMAEHAVTHELMHAIHEIVPLSATHSLRANSEYFLKDAAGMGELFHDVPEVVDESLRIADACDYDLDLGTYHFPNFPIPTGETPTSYLARRCFDGAARRYGRVTQEIEGRLQHELNLIFRMGFAAYFVLVADIIDHIRTMGVRCACRGSAAGSLVCYVLGISDVDPVRYDLLFERFMNARRDELPDIDVDVESHRREDVLTYILQTYGSDQTAVCCMVDTFRARMAIREVGKALALPPEEIDIVAKAFPRIAARHIPDAIERLPELAGSNLRAGQLEQLFELCLAIDGFPRHLALHPSGVILSSPDLAERVPMQESFQGFRMLQADKHDVEDLGLTKLDVLGVRMFSAIAHAHDEIMRTSGEDIRFEELPRDDEATFRLIRTSRTLGCFQIESPGQRELLARFQPNRFEDLIVDISLFRPGPVKSDMISPLLDRRHGFQEVRYIHDALSAILRETHGVVVYHEQLIRCIAAVTGCSLDDADYVRRHLEPDAVTEGVAGPIGITPPDEGIGTWFKARGVANGFTQAQADAIWTEVFAFASFGFCKSHAAAFALPTYISAWLKTHYPAEFVAGVLTHEPGMYPRRFIVADARQMGIPILPIDINKSDVTYRVEFVASSDAQGVRLALSEVRDISQAEMASIVHARGAGPFSSLEDLWRRTELSQPVLENLVHIGALDAIETRSRHELLWRVIELGSEPKVIPGEQLQLGLDDPIQQSLPELPRYSEFEETEAELEISGIDARRHIMALYAPLLAEIGCVDAERLKDCANRTEVWVAGVKVASQTPAIRSGQRIIFVTLDELAGPIDVTVFERVQPRCARTVFHSWLQLVRGEVRKRGGASFIHTTDRRNVGITVVAEEVFDLAELAQDRKDGKSLADAL